MRRLQLGFIVLALVVFSVAFLIGRTEQQGGTLYFTVDQIEGVYDIRIDGEPVTAAANDLRLTLPPGSHHLSIDIIAADGNWTFADDREFTIETGETTYVLADLKRQPTQQQQDIFDAHDDLIRRSKAAPKTDSRYQDMGDNTVIDTVTNLMWKKCAEGLAGENCDRGTIIKLPLPEAQAHARQSDFAGYQDWRIPTYAELRTLVDCPNGSRDIVFDEEGYLLVTQGQSNNGQCLDLETDRTINQALFPNTPGKRFWTSSSLIDYDVFAWNIHFTRGSMYYDDVKNTNRFRLVRDVVSAGGNE